ncbi:hypothetical protein H8I69_20955 [Serratia fonticola]|uniref:hypothetical protein n=1 Tax=Serratia fonticola TaxID=47917 RepID=UPI0015C64FE5|nr:hypothetical protein [Serratia fonticola]MBC3381590.1 hypothetical protein [Serratia fonticola]NYA40789.1 hypothetical protein [Serratia fonticola]
MKKLLILSVMLVISTANAKVINGKEDKPFTVDNKVVCLKEIEGQMTPFLKKSEMESGVKYKFIVKSGLSYEDLAGLRLQVNRVDNGLNDRVADFDYYWTQERGSMCQPAYLVLDRIDN